MKESVTHTFVIHASPEKVYKAWLDSDEHSRMTGGEAHCSNVEGDTFTAWDGYITGANLKLTPNQEIKQSWRTAEFEDEHEDSELVVRFETAEEGCEVTLIHTNIPAGQTQYENGWIESYIKPMQRYFSE